MKTRYKKILIIAVIFIIMFNFLSPVVLAADPPTTESSSETSLTDAAIVAADWGAGIFLYPIKLIVVIIGSCIELILDTVAGQTVTPETVLFNKVDLVNINFFESNSSQPFVQELRNNVAFWYYGIRNVAIIASVCILLYVGIRMAISTVAEDKAKYKTMIMDWLVSFALIFVLHYIVILTIYGNNVIVDVLRQALPSGDSGLTAYIGAMKSMAMGPTFKEGMAAAFIYLILLAITLGFFVMYIKRLIVTAFLIIIAPLITVTYSIDKIGNGKAEALNNWLKEFVWTILIQPFHCLIYLVFVTISLSALQSKTLASSVLAIMCMVFITQAESIVKKIFGVQSDNVGKLGASMALATGGIIAMGKIAGKGAAAGAKGAGKAGEGAGNINTKPKTKDEQLGGVPNSARGSSRENSTGSPSTANKTESTTVQKAKEKLGNIVNSKVGQGVIGYTKWSADKAAKMTGAAFGLVEGDGDVTKAGAGWIAGGLVGQGIANTTRRAASYTTNSISSVLEKGRTRNIENNLNESYRAMKSETGWSDDQVSRRAQDLISIDLSSEIAKGMSDMERAFAANLQRMQVQLGKIGADNSDSDVISKIKLKDVDNNK